MAMHLYRTQRTPIETLLACHVGRDHVVEGVLADLRARGPGASRQHFMFIGPRGIGKTTLLRLIAHGIETDPDLSARYLPIVFPEEGYSLTRVSDLMVRMAQTLAQEHRIEEFQAVHDQVRHDEHDRRVVDAVVEALRRHFERTGRGVVVMFENTNRFLERQKRNKDELHQLRALMISESWLTGVFTSPTYLNALTDEREPFFEFFKVQTLGELSQDELLDMLGRLTEHEDNAAFREYLAKHSSRVRALYHFTGGNPRLALMLYDLATKHDITGVREELDQLLDQITPFYQDRMKDLSEQEARVIEAMSLIPEGCPPKTLATETRLGQGVTRMVLKRLEDAGYVRREKHSEGKTVYVIPERLFRIWNSMNNSRAAKGKVQYLVEFFAAWYATEEERAEVWERLLSNIGSKAQENDTRRSAEYVTYIYGLCTQSEKMFMFQYVMAKMVNVFSGGFREDMVFLYQAFGGHYFEQTLICIAYIFGFSDTDDDEVIKHYKSEYPGSVVTLIFNMINNETNVSVEMIDMVVVHCIDKMRSNVDGCYEFGFFVLLIEFGCARFGIQQVKTIINTVWRVVFSRCTVGSIDTLFVGLGSTFHAIFEQPHEVVLAWQFISSRSPAVLEKHPPEVREAALKLVEAFDSNPANQPPPGGPGSGN